MMMLHSDAIPSEIKVTEAWLRLIRFCIMELPHGEIRVRIINGEPATLIDYRRNIRFDKPGTIPLKID